MFKNRNWWLLGGFTFGLCLSLPITSSSFFDDTYIHARIAENFLTYGVPSFNDGDHIKSSSSTGYVLLIAYLSNYFGLLNSIRLLEAISIIIITTGMALLVHTYAEQRFAKLVVALCVIPFILIPAYGGMETPIVCMLLTLAAISYRFRRPFTAVLLISISTWFRFELILLLMLSLSYYVFFKEKKTIILAAIPTVALFSIEMLSFGGVVPHAAKVKSIAYGYPLKQSVLNVLSFDSGNLGIIFGISLLLFLIIKVFAKIKNIGSTAPTDLFFALSAGVYLAWMFGRSSIFEWYYCLLVVPFCLAVISDDLVIAPIIQGRRQKLLYRFAFFIALGFGIIGFKSAMDTLRPSQNKVPEFTRVDRYIDIGSALYSHCPSCKLVTSEIGGLGYSFKGKVYDAFGLGDPEALRFHPMKVPAERQGYGVGAIPPKYVEYRDPDFIVSMPIFSLSLRASGILDNYIGYDCPLDIQRNVTLWGDTKIQVFSKKILPDQIVSRMGCEKSSVQHALDSKLSYVRQN